MTITVVAPQVPIAFLPVPRSSAVVVRAPGPGRPSPARAAAVVS